MSGPQVPIRMKINLTTGSSSMNMDNMGSNESRNSSETPDLEVPVVIENEDRDESSSQPGSRDSGSSSHEISRPPSRDGPLLKFSLPTSKSQRKRKHIKSVANEKVDDHIALIRQKEKERLAEKEKRNVSDNDHIAKFNEVTQQMKLDVDIVDIVDSDGEDSSCQPCSSKAKKEDYEVIDVSSGEEEDWGANSTPRRVIPSKINFTFGDYRRRGAMSTVEREQQEKAQLVEKARLKGKNFDVFDKDIITNREGGLLVNSGHPPTEEDVFVCPHLTHVLQPHQLGGVRFMYDNAIVSLEDYQKNKLDGGFGCILAHSMGLGKTLQVITMTEIFFRATKAHKVLILCPINTIQNWYNEYNRWIPVIDERGNPLRRFNVFLFGDSIKTFDQRVNLIEEWSEKGGVLLMGYEMFRLLNKHIKSPKVKKSRARIEFIGGKRIEEDEKEKEKKEKEKEASRNDGMTTNGRLKKEANDIINNALIDPGPELVICDEGHTIKNVNTDISITLSAIRTRRRIILTGYPLQNNLMEYYCMVNFVRPDYLGTKKSFATQFEKPIKNGQCVDSTPNDLKIARQRTHILIEMLRGFVQRRTQHILKQVLPDSKEYVLLFRKSPIQHVLYRSFVANTISEIREGNSLTFNPLKAFQTCTKFWNHPDTLYKCLRKLKEEKEEKERKEKEKEMSKYMEANIMNQFTPFGSHHQPWMNNGMGYDNRMNGMNSFTPFNAYPPFMNGNGSMMNGYGNELMGGGGYGMNESQWNMNGMNTNGGMVHSHSFPSTSYMNGLSSSPSTSSLSSSTNSQKKKKDTLASVLADELDLDPSAKYDWADIAMRGYQPGSLDNSPKMTFAMNIIDGCTIRGEKILLFSQNLTTLTCVEEFLSVRSLKTPMGEKMWIKNVNYYRFDGATNGSERERLINKFNCDPSVFLFLISTRAGSLGVNLVSATRCIIFDACWNPCHDAQAVCRIYRYGQQKKTFIYRLIMDNSMEKAIFNRQISKNGLQQRVVDEQQVDANVTQKELESLLVYDESLDVIDSHHNIGNWNIEDDVLRAIVAKDNKLLTQEPFLHESLLLEREEGLSEQEKMEAVALYEREKALDRGQELMSYDGISGGGGSSSRLSSIPTTSNRSNYGQLNMYSNPPPLRSTPMPMMLSQKGYTSSSGGATLGSILRLNSYQKFPPNTCTSNIRGPTPSSSSSSTYGGPSITGGIPTKKHVISTPTDLYLPAYGKPGELIFVPRGTPSILFDGGPTSRHLSLRSGPLLDASGVDFSSVIPSSSLSSTCSTQSTSSILSLPSFPSSSTSSISSPTKFTDVIELD